MHLLYILNYVRLLFSFYFSERFRFLSAHADFDLISGRYVIDAKSIMGIFSLDLSKPIELAIHTETGLDEIMEVLKPYIIDEAK